MFDCKGVRNQAYYKVLDANYAKTNKIEVASDSLRLRLRLKKTGLHLSLRKKQVLYTRRSSAEIMKGIDSGLAFAIASMFFLGISTFIYKRSTDALGPTNTTFFYYLFSVIIATGVWIFFREKQPYSYQSLVWPLAIAICLFLSVWFFNLAITSINISVAAPIRSASFIIAVLLAIIIAGERPGPLGFAGIFLAVVSVILLSLDKGAN